MSYSAVIQSYPFTGGGETDGVLEWTYNRGGQPELRLLHLWQQQYHHMECNISGMFLTVKNFKVKVKLKTKQTDNSLVLYARLRHNMDAYLALIILGEEGKLSHATEI